MPSLATRVDSSFADHGRFSQAISISASLRLCGFAFFKLLEACQRLTHPIPIYAIGLSFLGGWGESSTQRRKDARTQRNCCLSTADPRMRTGSLSLRLCVFAALRFSNCSRHAKGLRIRFRVTQLGLASSVGGASFKDAGTQRVCCLSTRSPQALRISFSASLRLCVFQIVRGKPLANAFDSDLRNWVKLPRWVGRVFNAEQRRKDARTQRICCLARWKGKSRCELSMCSRLRTQRT